MVDIREPRTDQDLNLQLEVEMIERQGKDYAIALSILDPRLKDITGNEEVVGFDIGSGADGVAFAALGFKKAMITNDASPAYRLFLQHSAIREKEIYREVQESFPTDTYFSSLSIDDWFSRKNFNPRLITMLRIAPQHFDPEVSNPNHLLNRFISFIQSREGPLTVVLSAVNDHESSARSFEAAGESLTGAGIKHLLYIDNVPGEVKVLGDRILAILK